jgi:hypothetical protein
VRQRKELATRAKAAQLRRLCLSLSAWASEVDVLQHQQRCLHLTSTALIHYRGRHHAAAHLYVLGAAAALHKANHLRLLRALQRRGRRVRSEVMGQWRTQAAAARVLRALTYSTEAGLLAAALRSWGKTVEGRKMRVRLFLKAVRRRAVAMCAKVLCPLRFRVHVGFSLVLLSTAKVLCPLRFRVEALG